MKKHASKIIISDPSSKMPYVLSAKTTILSPKQFKDFLALLRTLKGHVDHLMLVDGVFRAYTNRKKVVIEVIMPFFRNMDFVIEINSISIKKLSVLNKNSRIKVKLVGNEFIFQDDIVYHNPNLVLPSNANNRFVPIQDLNASFHGYFRYSNLILKATISKRVGYKTRVFAKHSSTNLLQFNHENGFLESAILRMDRLNPFPGEPSEWKTKLEDCFISPIKKNHSIFIPDELLVFKSSDITVNLFSSDTEDVLCAICNTNVGDLSIKIYCRGKLFEKI